MDNTLILATFFYFLLKMNNKITVVFCSKKNGKENEPFITHLTDTCGCDVKIICIYNPNGISLSKIYSDILESNEIETDIVAFIHDDIEFLRKGWGSEILRLFNEHEEYGIIGVAGSAQFDENGAWWNYERKFGQVLHRNDGKSWLTAFSPLLDKDLEEVVVVDGLFMAINRKMITSNFSKNLSGFDFYDIDFCLSNFIDKKCKIGVTTNIRIAHNSIGKLKDSWYENKEIINNKFKEHYPIEIKKNGK